MTDAARLGKQLRNARRAVRLSQSAVGESLGVTRQTIAAFEAGKRSPSFAQVPQLVNLYRVTADELLGAKSAVRPAQVPAFMPRVDRGTELDEQDVAELLSFEEYLARRGATPKRVKDFKRREFEGIESVAKRWREYAWKGAVPVPVFEMIAALGVEVRFTSLDSLAGAMIPAANDRSAGVLINSSQPYDRQRYTAAHELGHLVLDHAPEVCRTELGRRFAGPEVQADRFASELLVPMEALAAEADRVKRELGQKAPIQHIVFVLSRRFLVSFQAMTLRLDHLGSLQPSDLALLEDAKPLTIEKDLRLEQNEPKVVFDPRCLREIADRTLPSGWDARVSAETVRLLQTLAYSDYVTKVPEGSRADGAGYVYEKVALWISTNFPLV